MVLQDGISVTVKKMLSNALGIGLHSGVELLVMNSLNLLQSQSSQKYHSILTVTYS